MAHKNAICNSFQEIPGMAVLFMDSPYAWDYTVKQKDNMGGAKADRVMPYPRGFTLGGSR